MTYRRVECENPDCDKIFHTDHSHKKYCSLKCQTRVAYAKRNALFLKHYKMNAYAYYRRVKKGLSRVRTRRPGTKPKGKNFSLPPELIRRMRNFPLVNWSAVVTEYLDRHCLKLEMT